MNAISEVTSDLLAQKGVMNYENSQDTKVSETESTPETNSFLSILKLLDVNADDSLSMDELKSGLEGFISNFILSRDQNGDQALSAEEAGVSSGVISRLDTNSDQLVDGGEINFEADRILNGLVSILDTNGDGALSRDELAIFELLFAGQNATGAYQPADSGTENSSDLQKSVSLKV